MLGQSKSQDLIVGLVAKALRRNSLHRRAGRSSSRLPGESQQHR